MFFGRDGAHSPSFIESAPETMRYVGLTPDPFAVAYDRWCHASALDQSWRFSMRIDRQNYHRARPARFAALCEAGLNEIVEVLHGARHVRPYGSYTEWIIGDLVHMFQLPRRRTADPSWYCTLRPEIHVHDHVIVPDFAGWHKRRVRSTHARPFCAFSGERYVHAPDWICDIVEPSHAELVRKHKPVVYLELGVTHLWLLDPCQHRLEVYTAIEGSWQLTASHEGRHKVHATPLEQLAIDLGQLWPNPIERAAAECKALASITELLDDRLAAGVSEHTLLRRLLEECAPLIADDQLRCELQSDHAILRTVALIAQRVPINQALHLAPLEIAAEREARSTTTRAEAQRMSDDLLSQELAASIADVEAGNVITEKESLAQLLYNVRARAKARRVKPQPQRDRLEELVKQFQKHGALPDELARQALDGPDTHYIPLKHWPAIAREVTKRLAPPYDDPELSKRIRAWLKLHIQ